MKESLDPRINRFNLLSLDDLQAKPTLDQLPTYEVFVQPNEDKTFQHEGIVHASDQRMAFVFAKEQFSRRSTCTGLWTVSTSDIYCTPTTENKQSVYEGIPEAEEKEGESYLIFHLLKRGKQHKCVGQVIAASHKQALQVAKHVLDITKPVLNAWVIKESDIFMSLEEDKVIWKTLPEKTFREAIDYRGSDKIEKFKQEQGKHHHE